MVRIALLGVILLAGQLSEKFVGMREKALSGVKREEVGLLFLGDSITAGWGRNDVAKIWRENFGKYNPVNFGVPGYATGHVLQYTKNGGLDGLRPKAVVLLIGVNNTNGLKETGDTIAADIKQIVQTVREKLPGTKIVVTAIFPRGPQAERQETWENKGNQRMAIITAANKEIAKLDDGKTVRVLDLTNQFLVNGKPTKEYQGDLLHLTPKGYALWASGLKPLLEELIK